MPSASEGAAGRAPSAASAAALAAFAALAFFFFADPFLSPPDALSYWVWGESLFTDADFHFRDEYHYHQMPSLYAYVTASGRISNDWPPGTGILLGPWTLAGRIAAHAWVALLAVASLLFWIRRAAIGNRAVSVAAVVAGTPLLFYLLCGPFFSHVVSFAATTAFLTLWHATRPAEGRSDAAWFLLGAMLGFAAAIRPQNALLGIVFLAEASGVVAAWRARPRAFALHVGGGILGAAPQLLAWQALYGSPLALPKVEEMHWLSPAIGNVLFSDFHGIMPWTPVHALALVGLAVLARRDVRLALALILVFASQLYLNAANFVWWSGGSFGNRRMLDGAIVVAWGVGAFASARSGRAWRAATIACVAACCVWTLMLLLAERAGRLPLDRYFAVTDFAELGPALSAAFGDPAAMARGFARWTVEPSAASVLARAAAAGGLGAALFAMLRLRVPLGLRRAAIATAAGLLAINGLCAVALLRTGPLDDPEIAANVGTRPRVLWDNYIEYAYYSVLIGDYETAEGAALKAIDLRPNHYSGWFELGRARLLLGNYSEAVEAFDEALRLNPGHPPSTQFRAAALGFAKQSLEFPP